MRQLLFAAAGILISSAALAQQPVNKGVDGGPIGTSVPVDIAGSGGGSSAATATSVPIDTTVSSSGGGSGVSTAASAPANATVSGSGASSGVSTTTTSTGAGGAQAQLPAALTTPKVENTKNGTTASNGSSTTQTGGIEKGIGTTLAPTQTLQGSGSGSGAINK